MASACRAARATTGGRRSIERTGRRLIVPPSIRRASREMGEQVVRLGATWRWCAEPLATFLRRNESDGWHHPVAFGLLGARRRRARRRADRLLAPGRPGNDRRGRPGDSRGPHPRPAGAGLSARRNSQPGRGPGRRETETAGAGCPFYEILCDEQTRLYARMFRS